MAAADANTFTGVLLDRVAARRRDTAWLEARLHDPTTRALALTREGLLVGGEHEPELLRVPLGAIPGRPVAAVLLGVEADGSALFAIDVEHVHQPQRPLLPGARTLGLREAGALLPHAAAGLAAYASALMNWHRTHPHCARCGALTEMREAGHMRLCPVCHGQHHPRTDPVVIMLVVDGERVLLGRQASWPRGRYSALAGFVEGGESLEEAVAREVLEEAGVTVADPRYVSSQPWPFPSSLMIGFSADYAGGEAVAADGELEDVRWFTRDEVVAAAAASGSATWDDGLADAALLLPPPLAIARRLLDGWLAE